METSHLKKFAQQARLKLREQVAAKLDYVLHNDTADLRARQKLVDEIRTKVEKTSEDQLIEEVAYTWFNRFTALRYMDARGFTDTPVLPGAGDIKPPLLEKAQQGSFEDVDESTKQRINDLIDGKIPSSNPDNEVYKLLLVSACNTWSANMPFLFKEIGDYTELLMPDDMLSEKSIIADFSREMTNEDCEQGVEVIGWLYQFYISEKKDEVFAGLKKNQKITPDNIPAATQLFTPNWIVRYLVENSLGRLWMLNNPDSSLVDQMEYYIKPETPETDFIKISSPEELKVCDPACGSGHILVYAFELLYSIYEEQGYSSSEIPQLILENNLYGVELDERAGELAAFALVMKAREKSRRFFKKETVVPNICVLEDIHFEEGELKSYMDEVGHDLFSENLLKTLYKFQDAKNFGSLIKPECDTNDALALIESKGMMDNLFLRSTHLRVLKALKQADYLQAKYHCVIANPPYMGGKGMNPELAKFAKVEFPNSKSDLFSMFIERGLDLICDQGYNSMVTMESWMFLSSFEKLRKDLFSKTTINALMHMPYLGKGGTSMGISFGTSAFIFKKRLCSSFKGHFCCVRYYETDDNGVPTEFPPNNERLNSASSEDFKKIPGSPIAYWVSEKIGDAFRDFKRFEEIAPTRKGMVTARNENYVREWFELEESKSGFDKFQSRVEAKESGKKWFSYLKGGGFRKWFGNKNNLVNWENDGELLQTTKHPKEDRVWATNFNLDYIFKPNVNWGAVTSSAFSSRVSTGGEIFDAGGSACFPTEVRKEVILGLLNSKITESMLKALNPTLNFQAGNIANLPIIDLKKNELLDIINVLIIKHKVDWDSYENSWDFQHSPLIENKNLDLSNTYSSLRQQWQESTREMKRLEEENNLIFIEAYGLEDELTPEVPLKEITLTCNPYYRYGGDRTDEELEKLLLADTMREFISYAVGCMFGRYSLDKPGLILANQGETLQEYLLKVELGEAELQFLPDDDNIIPVLEGEYFEDDIVGRFYKFLQVTFGEENFAENLKFIEDAIGKNIRKFFMKEFYTDHVKRYKKRPIYWMFSSPKGHFNALIYMHRYKSCANNRLRCQ
ncbi:MAG: BREX-1 system adenine-specific DNA-methyltransferase PglX [Lentisphaeraceae bacterium]|nr:BREX-1 system adenine-specific DNA-methyltransferase PglX [Lentisphaeraceae bacterium]